MPAIAREMMISIKTRADEAIIDAAEMAVQYLCFSDLCGCNAANLSFCIDWDSVW
jgi:hypothetical protein